eukprot:PRCOL_00004799-RA
MPTALADEPLRLRGAVVRGFGRGSREMAVPTANVDPAAPSVAEAIDAGQLPKGVYYGWARLSSESGAAHPMVLNVGERPTFADGAGLSVEAHVLHEYAADFYDEEMRLLVCGAARPEQRFDGLEALVAQIHADIARARDALAAPACARWRDDALFE